MVVFRDEIGAPPGIIIQHLGTADAMHAVMDITVPGERTVLVVPTWSHRGPQPPLIYAVYPVAVGLILNMVPVRLTVFAIGT